jgi:hypothetical protein
VRSPTRTVVGSGVDVLSVEAHGTGVSKSA